MVRCKSAYRSGDRSFVPGQTVGDPALEAWLLRDSPGSWAIVEDKPPREPEPEVTTPEVEQTVLPEPPVHRAILGKRLPGRPKKA